MRKYLKRLVLWCLVDEEPAVSRDERNYTERTWRFTRALAFLSFALSVFAAVVGVMFLLTIWTVNNELVQQKPAFKFDENFDSIAAAASVGRLDIVAMVLTFLGVVAAFALIYGWTAFRSVAIDAAKAETKLRLPENLKDLMDLEGDKLVGLALQDAELLAKIQQGFTAVGIDDTDEANEIDDDPSWHEEEVVNG